MALGIQQVQVSKINPSPFQKEIYRFSMEETGNAFIDAVAGSGKTTTIVEVAKMIPSSQKALFLAFNKKIAMELESRLPRHVTAATFHSVGLAAWRRYKNNKVNVNGDKLKILALQNFKGHPKYKYYISTIVKLISKVKTVGLGIDSPVTFDDLETVADHFGIDLPDDDNKRDNCLECALELGRLSIEAADPQGKDSWKASFIDFDDMLYMPIFCDIDFTQVDHLMVDEGQDTNGLQRRMIRKQLKTNGRVMIVGDENQSIYAFRGADSDAIKTLKQEFNCVDLPLHYCYRCAKSIVKKAQTIVPHIQSPETAIEGEVIENADILKQSFSRSDVILCRNTKPLVDLAYYLISKGTGCKILGRDFGEALLNLVEKMGARNIEDLINKLAIHLTRQTEKYLKKDKPEKADTIEDQVKCICAVIDALPSGTESVSAVIEQIDRMFTDTTEGILTLSTIHRSKGLEWDRVFLYKMDLLPSKYAKKEYQLVQEKNLEYVAYTRAKKTLVILNGDVSEKE